MCTVSMIGDHYQEKWTQPPYQPGIITILPDVSKEDFDALKREVEEMKLLLVRAKKYDEDNGEPDCEMEDKVAMLRKIAEAVGVDLEDIFGKEA